MNGFKKRKDHKIIGEDNLVQEVSLLWAESLKITTLFFYLIMHHLTTLNNTESEMVL